MIDRKLVGSAATCAATAAAAVLALLEARSDARQDGPAHGRGQQPAHLFQARCASCHVVPDPGIETDLAWLGQIRDTA